MKDGFEVRDLRDKEWFIVDDRYLNGYARYCGIYATGVYLVLCRHADKEQSCFPSVALIAEKLNISKRQVLRALETLKEYRIIRIDKDKGKHNVYYLLDKKHWVSQTGDSQSPVTTSHHTSDSQSPELVTTSHPKDTHIRKHKKDILSASADPVSLQNGDNPAKTLFEYWNSLEIIQHRSIEKYRRHLEATLKTYAPEEIGEAMKNYRDILDGEAYFFKHRWTLDEFLSRKGGLEKFLTVNNPFDNFRKRAG